MRSTYITAIVIAVGVVVWLGSGQLGSDRREVATTIAEQNQRIADRQEDRELTRVRASVIYASNQQQTTTLRGRTQNKRTVTARAQVSGTLIERTVDRGDRVSGGDVVCRISTDVRDAMLEEARQALNQAQLEYEGSQRLSKEGLQSDTVIAQTKTSLAIARTRLEQAKLEVAQLQIRSPFDGLIEDIHLEQGDYVTPGAACVTVVDLNPMLVIGRVPEKEVGEISTGALATAHLASGEVVTGPITFVGKTADESTRTYAFEMQVDNADFQIPSGVTARIDIPTSTVEAQRVSPALLALDDEGRIGIRTIDGNNVVAFHLVEIIADDTQGIWVTGLPRVATVITVGQELVIHGEKVEPSFQSPDEASASTLSSLPRGS